MTVLAHLLATNSGIDADYKHRLKCVTSLAPLTPASAILKWYGIYEESLPIPEEVTQMARRQLLDSDEARGMGFVLLHRCSETFYFLIICTWRNSNEMWETVRYKAHDNATSFNIFPRDEAHEPALCVWELVPVWHEQQAWTRFLTSARDEPAAQLWLQDCYAGLAG